MKFRMLFFALSILIGISTPAWAVYCEICGNQVTDNSKFCSQCGKPLTVIGQPGTENPAESAAAIASYSVITTSPAPQAFQVTSNYLLVNGYRIYKNNSFWIAEVSGSRARIWSVNAPPYSELVMGWVSLTELEKRSTLKPGASIVCVEPPPPTSKIVVIEHRSFWQRWGFFSGPRHSGHYRHDDRRHHRR